MTHAHHQHNTINHYERIMLNQLLVVRRGLESRASRQSLEQATIDNQQSAKSKENNNQQLIIKKKLAPGSAKTAT